MVASGMGVRVGSRRLPGIHIGAFLECFSVLRGCRNLGPIDQVKIADFNEDGRLDLVSTNESEVSILLGNGDGTFQNSVSYPLLSPVSIGVADFDRDGNADVVAVTINNGLFLLRGNGDGSFQSPQFISAGIDFGVETGISTVTENLT
jgi:hypothetical protein